MFQRNKLYLGALFLMVLFFKYPNIDETRDTYLISEIKQWTPHSIQTEFNECRSIGLWQCGNSCSGIKNSKLAVVDCLSQNSNDMSKCDGVYQSLNF
jgi:hypothetical protein